ncbi:hypothetical protein ACHAXA_001811 [Cyclostephanos tholiformis]|uniref:Protein ENHANCED DISEASE RESISTANCE 2 C-terminal domain-containing protein n=1 Tax=Cyclostephanos tholiformis TaxID=382380 RepID=A0ABD3SED5_9STRA
MSAILRASLLGGTLSIKVIDVDIRRDLSHNLSARVEADYILKIDIGAEVDTCSETRLIRTYRHVREVDEYFCSKRYADFRHLAHAIGGHAEKISRYYAAQRGASSSKTKVGSGGGGGGGGGGGYLHGALDRATRALHYVAGGVESARSPTRHGASDDIIPSFVRAVLVGTREFCDEIHSMKRLHGMRYSWSHVKGTAERRRAVIDRAFSHLIHALSVANLSSVSERFPESTIPAPLLSLIGSLETFLLTDVLVDLETDEKTTTLHGGEDAAAAMGGGVRPHRRPFIIALRRPPRRSSYVDRMAEERNCREAVHISLSEDGESTRRMRMIDDGVVGGSSAGTTMNGEMNGAYMTEEIRPVPCHPTDFGLFFAIGVVFFKAIEGRSLHVQLDTLAMFGLACVLLGRQWTVRARRRGGGVVVVAGASSSRRPAPEGGEEEEADDGGRKGNEWSPPSLRPALQRITGSTSLSTHQARRFSLLQKSLCHVSHVWRKDDETIRIVPARTFHEFPRGAAIGSHHNRWSSPPSENFQVRGANYLRDKAKVPSADYLFPCRGCDLFLTDNAPINVGRNRCILGGKLRDLPTFIINYRLPWGIFVSYHEIPERFLPFLRRGNRYGDLDRPLPPMNGMTAGDRAVCKFFLSDKDAKNKAWKLIPVVVDGPWVVKRVVGGKPAIVGTKLPISYVYQPPDRGLSEYFEADLDIVSSAAARNVLAVVRSYTQVLTIDLGYVVQGSTDDELPEQMMVGLRLHGLDPLTADLLPDFEDASTLPQFDDDSGNETD